MGMNIQAVTVTGFVRSSRQRVQRAQDAALGNETLGRVRGGRTKKKH